MKFLITFTAILAVSAAVYVAPVAQHAVAAYTPYIAASAYYGAHHLYKRGIYTTPVASHAGYTTPYTFAAHHLYKRGIVAPVTYTQSAGYITPYTVGAHHLYKRGVYASPTVYPGSYYTPYTHYY